MTTVMTFVGGFFLFWLSGVLLVNHLIFHPPEPGYELDDRYRTVEAGNGTSIVYRVFENPDTDRVMIYSHGNAEDLTNLEGVMTFYRDLGYTVVAYDYPGYGHSGGTPTVDGATEALLAVIRVVSEGRNLDPEKLTLFGKSIGGGPTVAAASRMPVGGLILESTFTSVFQVPLPFLTLPLDPYPNRALLPKLGVPVLIIHGRNDTVIPPIHAERLFELANAPKRLVWIDDAGHNDLLLSATETYQDAIRDFPGSSR